MGESPTLGYVKHSPKFVQKLTFFHPKSTLPLTPSQYRNNRPSHVKYSDPEWAAICLKKYNATGLIEPATLVRNEKRKAASALEALAALPDKERAAKPKPSFNLNPYKKAKLTAAQTSQNYKVEWWFKTEALRIKLLALEKLALNKGLSQRDKNYCSAEEVALEYSTYLPPGSKAFNARTLLSWGTEGFGVQHGNAAVPLEVIKAVAGWSEGRQRCGIATSTEDVTTLASSLIAGTLHDGEFTPVTLITWVRKNHPSAFEP
jgi:hypothetical protein